MRRFVTLTCLSTALALSHPAHAQDTAQTQVTLSTGEVLKGTLRSHDTTTLVLTHPILGEIRIPTDKIAACDPPIPPPPPEAPAAEPPATTPPAEPERRSPIDAVLAKDERPFWRGWTHSLSVGLNSSEGNTDSTNGRTSLVLQRATAKMKTDADLTYVYSKDAGGTRKSRGDAALRNDWRLGASPWRLFAHGLIEYDQFAGWDWRATGTAGIGYALLSSDKQELTARLGAGVSQDFGGPDDKLMPIGVGGLDYTRKLSDHSSLFVNFDYFPDLSAFREFRTATKAGYQILLDQQTSMMLRLGAEHRHDSDPGDAEATDVEYYVTLGWQF